MGSYLISVSLGTGCYRHIQIARSATLYRLHKAILSAFDFKDGHAHAFFMDNRYWSAYAAFVSMKIRGDERLTKSCRLDKAGISKGSRFKYIYDFGDEWRFQCRVLRELDEPMDLPCVVRRVGEVAEQHPDDEDDWEEDLSLPEEGLTQEKLDELYARIPLAKRDIERIRKYIEAAARLYGLISLDKLCEIYNSQNPPVEKEVFLLTAGVINCEDNPYMLIKQDLRMSETIEEELAAVEIAADYLFVDNAERDIRALRREQKDKPYQILPRAEFLRYAEPTYFPATPQRMAMLNYLRSRRKELTLPPEDFCSGIQDLIVIDAPLEEILNITKPEGLRLKTFDDVGTFMALFQDLNNHTHKHVNRGHTPSELAAMGVGNRNLKVKRIPDEQMSLFGMPAAAQANTPLRNAPCPCGSGKKYKHCCGKK